MRESSGSYQSNESSNGEVFHLTPDESPLLSNGPTGHRPSQNAHVPSPVQPVDVNPELLTHGDEKWFFSDHARALLQKTKLGPHCIPSADQFSGPNHSASNLIGPSASNDTCYTSTLTAVSGYSFSTFASPNRKNRVISCPSETDDDKCYRNKRSVQRPATPELDLPSDSGYLFLHHDELPGRRTSGPNCEPRPQRSTSYLGVSHAGPGVEQKTVGALVPKKYRFDDAKQAYIHEDSSIQVVHNMACAVDPAYEPSTTAMNVSKFFLAVQQKPAVHTRKLFHGLRSYLNKTTSSDVNDVTGIVQIKTGAGDRRLHKDLMSPWVQPSDKYANADIYQKYRVPSDQVLFQFDGSDEDEETDHETEPELQRDVESVEFRLADCIDLRRHNVKDVDLFLCFLYGHVKKEEIKRASIGAMSIIALDCGLFKLHQVLEQIVRDYILETDCLEVMTHAASVADIWLNIAAFDYITSNFYYYQNGLHYFNWSVEELEIYVKADQLRLKTEFDVFTVILDWLAYDNKANIQHANRLLNCIRFFRMTTEEIHECLSLNAQLDIFQFSQMQILLTIHLLIQDYIKKGEDSQLSIPEDRVVTQLSNWDPRQLYCEAMEAQLFLQTSEPFVQETIVQAKLREERQAHEMREAAEKAKLIKAEHDDRVREEEDRCKKLFEMMGICMDGRNQQTVEMLKTKELQALIPFLEPVHARWPWPGPPSDGGKLDHRKDSDLYRTAANRVQLKT